ncbi:hypothetical protein J2Z21_009115 [Streptomyces griseochromogenes]|uniref:Transposase n=2 Tax=Streptomyces griseochromogenes TaxID=68214 RepID=A0ABS4M8Y8_9ACTN|nr:hypothetical protein [Streptomyces griseochromogenes]
MPLVLQLHFAIAAGQWLVSEHTQLTSRHVGEVRDRRPSIAVVLIMQDDVKPGVWALELEEVLLRVGHRFGRVDLRRRMRDYVRGLLGPVGRKNGWQLAEYVGLDGPVGLQHLLNRAHGIHRRGAMLPAWIDAVDASQLPGLTGFALHLLRDIDAVTAGLTLVWSSGGPEGAVNRIKKIKRQLYGRAGFGLLRKMILLQ